ncbi:FG-GAP repeat domain-containing protein [Streptomyces sp. MSC1_001]|uniref:FG-GAP repeat domain-containing protein n=1 Tax=Streptomyces sp. MSC1_001 TaxID=2909263 RepID=UPI0027E3CA3E|nr:VCBS repeat-containing protein [Streptomyces sp. MSC1_001]
MAPRRAARRHPGASRTRARGRNRTPTGTRARTRTAEPSPGGAAGDLVARDTSGVLCLRLGKGDGTFAPRTRIGGGWNMFGHLVGAGDVDGDGRPDLIGYGAEGTYLYRATGGWETPFTRVTTQLYDGPGEGSAYSSLA